MYYVYNADGTYTSVTGVAPTDVAESLSNISKVVHDLHVQGQSDSNRIQSIEHQLEDFKEAQASSPARSEHNEEKEEKEMAYETPMNIFTNPNGNGGNDGFGMGGGLLGGVILGSLIGNRGGLFGANGAGVAEVGVPAGSIALATLQAIGDVKASVPLSACEVMGSVSAAAADITSQTLSQTIGLNQNINDAKSTALAAANANALQNAAGFANVKDATDALSTQTAVGFGIINANIERTGWALSNTVRDDGDKTRALIQSIDKTNDSRLITAQANEIVELRQDARRLSDTHGIAITMNNNQNQQQLQFQQQAQAINTLAHGLADVSQIARATNQQLIIGNAGATTTGAQTANPVNVRT